MNTEEIKDVSWIEVATWLGSDVTRQDLINIIVDLANGYYEPHVLFKDIRDYNNEIKEPYE